AMVVLRGDGDAVAADAAERVVALETRLAAGHWDNVTTRDVVKAYNLTSYDDLVVAAPAFDFPRWLAGVGADPAVLTEVIVRQPPYLGAFSAALTEVPLADWKMWLRFHLVSSLAP